MTINVNVASQTNVTVTDANGAVHNLPFKHPARPLAMALASLQKQQADHAAQGATLTSKIAAAQAALVKELT